MSLPLWDPIDLPPSYTLVDINSLEEPLRAEMQAEALRLWIDETGEPFAVREWDDNEGIFAVYEDGEIVGISIMTDVENE